MVRGKRSVGAPATVIQLFLDSTTSAACSVVYTSKLVAEDYFSSYLFGFGILQSIFKYSDSVYMSTHYSSGVDTK